MPDRTSPSASTEPLAGFCLRFEKDRFGSAKTVSLGSANFNAALRALQIEEPNRSAELWSADRRLCRIERLGDSADFWLIEPG